MARELTRKQQMFVDVFDGNATHAAKSAGYASPKSAGSRLLTNDSVKSAIVAKEKPARKRRIANKDERMEFLTDSMRGNVALDGEPIPASLKMRDRLKANELLGRAHGDFVDRKEIAITPSFADLISGASERSEEDSTGETGE